MPENPIHAHACMHMHVHMRHLCNSSSENFGYRPVPVAIMQRRTGNTNKHALLRGYLIIVGRARVSSTPLVSSIVMAHRSWCMQH